MSTRIRRKQKKTESQEIVKLFLFFLLAFSHFIPIFFSIKKYKIKFSYQKTFFFVPNDFSSVSDSQSIEKSGTIKNMYKRQKWLTALIKKMCFYLFCLDSIFRPLSLSRICIPQKKKTKLIWNKTNRTRHLSLFLLISLLFL